MSRRKTSRPAPKKSVRDRQPTAPARRPQAKARDPRIGRLLISVVIVGIAGAIGIGISTTRPAERPAATQAVEIGSVQHVAVDVDYGGHPVGGDHAAIWLNCGVYREETPEENAVHSLEHGAVWVTYRPADVPAEDVSSIEDLAGGKVIISPRTEQPAPIVAAAWGQLLEVQTVADPDLAAFVSHYKGGGQAPEAAGRCSGGVGNPS